MLIPILPPGGARDDAVPDVDVRGARDEESAPGGDLGADFSMMTVRMAAATLMPFAPP
jgi:hypothetical protein